MRRMAMAAGTIMMAAGAMTLAGCAGYGNYPQRGGAFGMSSPNTSHMSEVTRRAIVAAVDRAGLEGRYAVRVPEGTDITRRERIIEALNDPDATIILGDAETNLPEVAVERVIVRVNRAEVDVSLPYEGLQWPDGEAARQLTTYYLKSEFGGWRVTRMRTWSLGVGEGAIAQEEPEGEG